MLLEVQSFSLQTRYNYTACPNSDWNKADQTKCIGAGPGILGPYTITTCASDGLSVLLQIFDEWDFSRGECYQFIKNASYSTQKCIQNPYESQFEKPFWEFLCS